MQNWKLGCSLLYIISQTSYPLRLPKNIIVSMVLRASFVLRISWEWFKSYIHIIKLFVFLFYQFQKNHLLINSIELSMLNHNFNLKNGQNICGSHYNCNNFYQTCFYIITPKRCVIFYIKCVMSELHKQNNVFLVTHQVHHTKTGSSFSRKINKSRYKDTSTKRICKNLANCALWKLQCLENSFYLFINHCTNCLKLFSTAFKYYKFSTFNYLYI